MKSIPERIIRLEANLLKLNYYYRRSSKMAYKYLDKIYDAQDRLKKLKEKL